MASSRAHDCLRVITAAERLTELVNQAESNYLLEQWRILFRDEINTVCRARNNVVWQDWISDSNLRVAGELGDRLLTLARKAKAVAPPVPPPTPLLATEPPGGG